MNNNYHKTMKKYLSIFAAALALVLCGCNKTDNGEDGGSQGGALTVNFTVTPETVYAGDAVAFAADIKGGTAPYTIKWTIGSAVQAKTDANITFTFPKNGSFVVTLDVTDTQGAKAQKKKAVVVNAAKVEEVGTLSVNWVGKMNGYNSKSAAAVADDGSVYTTCRDNKLYKWSATGESVWVKDIYTVVSDGSVTYGTPSVDKDGTVFIGTGSKDGTLRAFNPDGSVKWTFNQWYRSDGQTPAPTCQGTIVAIDDHTVYFGCTGQNGIVLSADKSTGARKGFLAPAGGARSGIALTRNGMVTWYGGKYGIFGMTQATLDAGGNDPLSKTWQQFGSGDEQAANSYEGQIALLTIAGEPCVGGIVTDTKGTKVYAVKASDGTIISQTYIDDTDAQDQGGVVVDKSGNLVASLNFSLGMDNGGIAIVNPAEGKVVARYRTQEKVSGSPAIDKAGNIHFGTESGYYYIVKQSGDKCDLVLKRNLSDVILADDRYKTTFADLGVSKIWSSPVIGDDGKMYICFTDNSTRAFGGVACLSFEGCQGPADSDWPMIGHDRRHTGKQN